MEIKRDAYLQKLIARKRNGLTILRNKRIILQSLC